MKTHQASATAQVVALWRALAHDGATSVPAFNDPFASEFLQGRFRAIHALIRRGSPRSAERREYPFDSVPIRVAAIDRLLEEAVARQCRQVVMLGAGYDTRAYRLQALAGTSLFEVDHPATQATKRALAAKLPAPLTQQQWVSVDFLRDSLSERLVAAGFSSQVPTAWVWEGVVMYLGDDALTHSLETIRRLSAPGSELMLHYHEPSERTFERVIRRLVLASMSEPQIGVRCTLAMHGFVERAGLRVERDLSLADQVELVRATLPRQGPRVSRILVAQPDHSRQPLEA